MIQSKTQEDGQLFDFKSTEHATQIIYEDNFIKVNASSRSVAGDEQTNRRENRYSPFPLWGLLC